MARPVNVQIQRADGTTIDCELIHLGEDEQGDHWAIAEHIVDLGAGDHITADELPARTSLAFRTPEEAEEEPGAPLCW